MAENVNQAEKSNTPREGQAFPVGAIVLGALAVGAVGVLAYTQMQPSSSSDASPSTTQQSPDTNSANASDADTSGSDMSGEYRDGSYSVTGAYTSPGGAEEIEVTIELQDGIIVSSEVTPLASRPISLQKQEAFAAEQEAVVVGKSIESVQLDKLAGASLTPKGFNDALEQVKAQARV